MALAGRVEFVYGYSFILTDLTGDVAEIEPWHRPRGRMEERVTELRLGDGLLHFPLGSMDANRAWQTAAVIAHNLVASLSAVVADVNHRYLQEQLSMQAEVLSETRRPSVEMVGARLSGWTGASPTESGSPAPAGRR